MRSWTRSLNSLLAALLIVLAFAWKAEAQTSIGGAMGIAGTTSASGALGLIPDHTIAGSGTVSLPACDASNILTVVSPAAALSGNIVVQTPAAGSCGTAGATPQKLEIDLVQASGHSYTCALQASDSTPIHSLDPAITNIPANFCPPSVSSSTPLVRIQLQWDQVNTTWDANWQTDPPGLTPTTLAGTTAGNIYWSQPIQAPGYKRTVLNFQGYENTTGTAQTISYPAAYSYVPGLSGSCPAGLDVSDDLTKVSVPISMTGTFTGQCFVEGQ